MRKGVGESTSSKVTLLPTLRHTHTFISGHTLIKTRAEDARSAARPGATSPSRANSCGYVQNASSRNVHVPCDNSVSTARPTSTRDVFSVRHRRRPRSAFSFRCRQLYPSDTQPPPHRPLRHTHTHPSTHLMYGAEPEASLHPQCACRKRTRAAVSHGRQPGPYDGVLHPVHAK